jgi:hypothetical protein
MSFRIIAAAGLALALSAGIAGAQDRSADSGFGAVREACKDDMQRLCGSAEGGEARRACMRTNQAQFGAACQSAIKTAEAQREAFRAACGEDIKRLCGDVQRGGGMRECLAKNADKVGPACKTQLAQRPGGPAAGATKQ